MYAEVYMKILIVGGGTVGAEICSQLALEGHDITLIDNHSEILTSISNKYDVFGVVGNGADISVLKKANVDKADLLIAVSSNDEINILCGLAAKKLGVKHTIARVRNPEYSELIRYLKNDQSLSMTINPEFTVAKEIYRSLRLPSATKVNTFCRGRVEMAEFTVTADSPFCNIALNDLRNKLNIRFLVCAVLRDGEAHIPNGYFSLCEGDTVCVTVPEDYLTKFFKAAGIYKQPVRDVLIVGGGRTTYYLQSLLEKGKINSTIIDSNKENCHKLADQFKCNVICDDVTNQERLLEEGLAKTDAFIALSPKDEENAVVSMYAKSQGTGKIITNISTMAYIDLFRGLGLDSIVSPKSSTVSHIIRFVRSMANVRGSEIESLHRLLEDKVEALEFRIKEDISGITSIPFKELKIRSGVLVACIFRNENMIIPSGDDFMLKGDTVIVVTTESQIKGIKEILK